MFANKKFLLLGLAVLIIISAVFFVMRNNLRQKGQELVNQQQNAETEKKESESIFSEEEATDLSRRFEKEFDTAFNMARGWQADSVMAAELIQYKGLASATNGKDTFVFYSPSSPQYYWTISFEPKADSPSERFLLTRYLLQRRLYSAFWLYTGGHKISCKRLRDSAFDR